MEKQDFTMAFCPSKIVENSTELKTLAICTHALSDLYDLDNAAAYRVIEFLKSKYELEG